ncbi:MAG: glycosyltransferase family 4 protein [Terriglobia bacterium]
MVFLVSALVAYGVTKLSIVLSLRRGVLDLPNVRSSHSQPMPRMGGVGILAGFYVAVGGLILLGPRAGLESGLLTRETFLFALAGAGMAIIGLCDDLYHLSPPAKFLMQFVLVACLLAFGARVDSLTLPFGKPCTLGFLALPVTMLWLTGFANIFNFMDGINGMAAGTGVVYSGLFFLVARSQGDQDLATLAVVLGGSCLGFLFHNFPVARTFMGDTGSLFLGIVFALFVVRLPQRSSNPASLVALLLGTSIYLWDSGFTLLRRLKARENIFLAHRSHLYQRLVQAGLTHVKVTALYVSLQALMGVFAFIYLSSSDFARLGILVVAGLLLAGLTGFVYWLELRQGAKKATAM